MNNNQNAKLSMAQRVIATLTEHKDVFSGITPMLKTTEDLSSTVTAIREAAIVQTAVNVSGQTAEKRAAEEKMITAAVKISNTLYVIGFLENRKDFEALLGLSAYSFYQVDDNRKLTLATHLLNLAKTNASALVEYGIDEAQLEEIGAGIAAYEKVIGNPMRAIAIRKQKTSNIKELFATLDSILYDKLDRMMVLFQESHPEFYGEYRNSRNVINTSVIHRK
jgi:NADH:ubiquinone oxidoreductase subunit C